MTTNSTCNCGGRLEKVSFSEALAALGGNAKGFDKSHREEDYFLCRECRKAFASTKIIAQADGLDEAKANRKDFGFAHGRA